MEQKDLFDSYFRKRRYENAHHNFTNFFIWRNLYNIHWTTVGRHLCLKANDGGRAFMLQPIGEDEGVEETLEIMLDYCRSEGMEFILQGAEKFMVDIIERWRPDYFEYTSNRGNYDYVYLAQDLIELKGRKYHAKKNHVNKFKRIHYNYQYLPLTEEWTEKCIANLEEWCIKKDCSEDIMLLNEKIGTVEVFGNFSKLNLQGGIIVINDKVEAFTFGEALNDDTAVIHVEKANPDISGIYPAINQEFCRQAWAHMTYINREEDINLEGLRKAKESYGPVKMIEKFTVRVKQK